MDSFSEGEKRAYFEFQLASLYSFTCKYLLKGMNPFPPPAMG